MDPVLSQALASLIGAFTTAVLLAAAYYWGPTRRESRDKPTTKHKRLEDDDSE